MVNKLSVCPHHGGRSPQRVPSLSAGWRGCCSALIKPVNAAEHLDAPQFTSKKIAQTDRLRLTGADHHLGRRLLGSAVNFILLAKPMRNSSEPRCARAERRLAVTIYVREWPDATAKAADAAHADLQRSAGEPLGLTDARQQRSACSCRSQADRLAPEDAPEPEIASCAMNVPARFGGGHYHEIFIRADPSNRDGRVAH
jgi:hypothetical protein